jgi:replicative DNA helicase
MNHADSGRVPPNDQNAERAVIGGIMLENAALEEVAGIPLAADDFYRESHAVVYEAMLKLAGEGRPVDTVTLREHLATAGKLAAVGGDEYLLALTDTIPTIENIEAHARIVREKAIVRRLIHTCYSIAAKGYGDYGNLADFIDLAETNVTRACDQGGSRATTMSLRDATAKSYENLVKRYESGSKLDGYATGFRGFDWVLGGLSRGSVTIIAGRPGMGKSAFAMGIAQGVARWSTLPVIFFSAEMPIEQLADRSIASHSGVSMSRIRVANIQREEWSTLTNSVAELGAIPIDLVDCTAPTLNEIRRDIRRVKRKHGGRLAVGVIDYLQLMGNSDKAESREQAVAANSRGLKVLAKQEGIALVVLSQLNRSTDTRSNKDKRPQLSDLRESGAIEQDADNVVFIYRDEVYNHNSEDKGIAEIIVAKQRNGATGTIRMAFHREYTRFADLHQDDGDQRGGNG